MKTFVAASNLATGYFTDEGINCVEKWPLEMGFDVSWVRVGQVDLDIWHP